MELLYISLFMLLGFFGMFFLYAPIADKYTRTLEIKPYHAASFSIFFIYAIGAIGGYFIVPQNDFINDIGIQNVVVPLFLACTVYFAQTTLNTLPANIITTLCVAGCVVLHPLTPESVPFNTNIWLFKIALTIFFSVFCCYYHAINAVVHTTVIPSIAMMIGLSILGVLGAAPVYLAICAALLIGILSSYLITNANEVKIGLSRADCSVIAFLISNLFILDGGEISFPSCVVFTVIFWTELLRAAWKRVFITKSGLLEENSHYYKAANNVPLPILSKNIAKVCGVCLFLGWFQLFSINQYSLIIVSFLIIFWLNGSVDNIYSTGKQSIHDINKEFFNNIKQSINEAKDNINKITEKKDK